MDRHGYATRGYADDWNKTNHGGSGGPDHVHRPVIVDADGRQKPFLPFTPNLSTETYFKTSAQRIVEHVHTPVMVAEYKYSSQGVTEPYGHEKGYGDYGHDSPTKMGPHVYGSPPKRDPMKNHGTLGSGLNEKWPRSSMQPINAPEYQYGTLGSGPNEKWPRPSMQPVNAPGYQYGTLGSNPNENWRRPSGPVIDAPENQYGYPTSKVEPTRGYGVGSDPNKWGPQADPRAFNNDSRDRPTMRPNILNAPAWRRPTGQGDAIGYNDYGDYNTENEWNKPNGNKNKFSERPGSLSQPTNDIEKAVEMLKEAVKTSPISVVPKWEVAKYKDANAIDSKEAARRYGNFNLQSSPRPYQTNDSIYSETIDSREATRRYGGAPVPKYN